MSETHKEIVVGVNTKTHIIMSSDKQHKKREFILRELVDTEAKFVRHMKEVREETFI